MIYDVEGVLKKQCSKCSRFKELKLFSKKSKSSDGYSSACKVCVEKVSFLYRQKNKDKRKKYAKLHYADNCDEIKEKAKRWSDDNKDIKKETGIRYRARNAETIMLKKKEYRDSEQGKETRSKFVNSEQGRIMIINSTNKRRARKLNTDDGSIDSYSLQFKLKKQDYKCLYCEVEIGHALSNIHLDHIHPLSKGGTHTIDNVQWLCATCNMKKSDKVENVPQN